MISPLHLEFDAPIPLTNWPNLSGHWFLSSVPSRGEERIWYFYTVHFLSTLGLRLQNSHRDFHLFESILLNWSQSLRFQQHLICLPGPKNIPGKRARFNGKLFTCPISLLIVLFFLVDLNASQHIPPTCWASEWSNSAPCFLSPENFMKIVPFIVL